MPDKSKQELVQIGQDVAVQYLHHQVPLNQGVKQAALDHALNPQQTALVCHFANRASYANYLANDPTQLASFPLADPDQVRDQIAEHQQAVVASEQAVPPPDASDYHRPPPEGVDPRVESESGRRALFAELVESRHPERSGTGVKQAEATALSEHQAYQARLDHYHKLAEADRQFRTEFVSTDLSRQNEEENLFQFFKERILHGETFDDICRHLAIDRGLVDEKMVSGDVVHPALEKVLARLKAENLVDRTQGVPGESVPIVHTPELAGTQTPEVIPSSIKQSMLHHPHRPGVVALSRVAQKQAECLVLQQALQTTRQEMDTLRPML